DRAVGPGEVPRRLQEGAQEGDRGEDRTPRQRAAGGQSAQADERGRPGGRLAGKPAQLQGCAGEEGQGRGRASRQGSQAQEGGVKCAAAIACGGNSEGQRSALAGLPPWRGTS